MNGPRIHRLRIAQVVAETADTHTLVFDLTAEQRAAFGYAPGQYLTIRVPSDRQPVARCYSLSSSPFSGEPLQVTIKRTAGGYGSNWLCDNVNSGDEIEALPPAGVFTPSSMDHRLLLIAGGSGITPIISILKSQLLHNGSAVLVYANRDEESVIFGGEINALAARHPDRLTVVHWLESVRGLPNAERLTPLLRSVSADEAFICGPEPFMAAARDALRSIGLARDRIHIEQFVSLTTDPFTEDRGTAAAVRTAPGSDAPVGTVRLEVEFEGNSHTLHWPTNQRLLDFLLSKGIEAPYSCTEGACATCECMLVEGKVEMVTNGILDEDDLAGGYILACQSLPLTDVVKVRYEH
jgi:3-ketosteroid 9alpha-monooxygenase subunit B